MKNAFLSLLTLAVLTGGLFADDKPLTVADLNSTKIVGELGFPLHTVHRVECRVVDMSFTGMKADDGRLGFRIISVDAADTKENHYIDIPSSLIDPKPRIGQTFNFWAYETVRASGYPTEAFKKLGERAFSTVGLHFRASLVILKSLDPKQDEQGGADQPATAPELKSKGKAKPQPESKVRPQ